MPKEPFKRIIIHCSDSEFGTALMIRDWHVQRKFLTLGYHSVITNGYPNNSWVKAGIIIPHLEGAVEIGRQINSDPLFDPAEMGAHIGGKNTGSYGICIIGKEQFSDKVLNKALEVVKFRMAQFGLKPENVYGHYEWDNKKTCPNIDMNEFRKKLVKNELYGEKLFIRKGEIQTKPVKELTLKGVFSFLKTIFKKGVKNG